MAIMGKPVWAVMCGAIRNDFELYSSLAQLCEYRSKGLLDGIVISTWKGEADTLPDLRKKLEELHIYLVELEPLDETQGKFCNLNFARQVFQLKSGLDFVPEDVFVLKCRTDNNDNFIQLMEKYILRKNSNLAIGTHGSWHTNLNYRIAVAKLPLVRTFWMLDRVFLGYKYDLYKMVNFDNIVIKYGCDVLPDMAFFLNCFLGEYPLLGEIWRLTRREKRFFDGASIVRRLQMSFSRGEWKKEDFELPGALNKYFALYLVILENCFHCVGLGEKAVKPFYLADVFLVETSIGMRDGGYRPARLNNRKILHMIINGQCLPTKGYIKLYREICRLKDLGYAHGMHITKTDYAETRAWIKDVLKVHPDKVLNWTDPEPSRLEELGFSCALDILYADQPSVLQNRDAFHTVMKDICFCGNIRCCRAALNNYERLKAINKDIGDASIPTIARLDEPYAYRFLAKELFEKRVSAAREENCVFIFKRYERNSDFYNPPVTSEMLAALYYYGKYAERRGDHFEARRFLDFLLKWSGDAARPEPESHVDAALALIREVVSKRYREYQNNVQLQYMIDFLLDEFGESAFTPDAAEFLGEYLAKRTYGRPFMLGQPDAYTRLLRGARTIQKGAAGSVLRLLLREMSSQPKEIREEAEKTIAELQRRFSLPDSALTRAISPGKGRAISLGGDGIDTEEDFTIFLRLLCMNGYLGQNRSEIRTICGDNPFRRFASAFFERLENTPGITFFTAKPTPTGLSLWVTYKPFMDTGYDNSLLAVHDQQRVPWPYADAASPSRFAAFLRWEQKTNRIDCSIEFYAEKTEERDRLLMIMQRERSMEADPDARLTRLHRTRYPIKRMEDISSTVNKALDTFCEIGDQLTACARKLQKSPSPSKKPSVMSSLRNFLSISTQCS